jgi:HEAT repeat protein
MVRYLKSSLFSLILLLSLNISAAELIRDKDLVSAITGANENKFQLAIDYIKLNQPVAIPSLLKDEYLDDDDEEIRTRIISALKEYPLHEQSAIWAELLRSEKNKNIEINLIELLSGSRSPVFTVPIAEKLLVPRSEVREKAAIMLKKSGDDRMLPVILSLVQSKNPIDRIYFLEALNYIYDIRFQKPAISMLQDENKSVRIYAIRCINNNEIKEALPSMRKLASKDDNNETRKMAIQSLVLFKDTGSGSILTEILKDPDIEMRMEAVKALRDLKHYSAAARISDMLTSESSREIKQLILDTIITFKKAGNINGLKHIIQNDTDPKMRIKAVYAAGVSVEENSSLPILKDALSDEDYRVRGEACGVMGSFRRKEVSEILINQIKTDKSRYVRSAALYSIVKINNSENIIRLFDIYSYEEDLVFKEILRDVIRTDIRKRIK